MNMQFVLSAFTDFCGSFETRRYISLSAMFVIGAIVAILFFAQRSFIFNCLGWGAVLSTVLFLTGNLIQSTHLTVFTCGLVLIFVIIYQQEIRELMIKITGSRTFVPKKVPVTASSLHEVIDAVAQTAVEFSREKTGALIILERRVKLDDVARSGVEIDSKVTPYLLRNIFFDKAPLHDGAVLIRNARVSFASCILPLTARTDIDQDLGTRHRAAIGLSEVSDAIVIVVSEETGVISVAFKSEFTRDYSFQALHAFLMKNMQIAEDNGQGKQ